MDTQRVTQWLATYKKSWETQDPDLFVTLFTPDCEYRDTPWIEPVPGRDFHAFWTALAKLQQDNHIELQVLGPASGNRFVINWQAQCTKRGTAERREGNGIFVLTFAPDGRCSDVREWQHWKAVGTPLERRAFTWQNS